MLIKPRFPDIDWYCDHCGSSLNNQRGFNDHKYIWKCKECGYKNSISWANIRFEDSIVMKWFLSFLGFLAYVGLWTSIILGLSIFDNQTNREKYFTPFLMMLGLYLISSVIAILVEVCLRHGESSVIKIIIRNLIEDITAPFYAIKECIFSFISIVVHLLPIKKKEGLNKNMFLIVSSFIYTMIFIVEMVAFANINQ